MLLKKQHFVLSDSNSWTDHQEQTELLPTVYIRDDEGQMRHYCCFGNNQDCLDSGQWNERVKVRDLIYPVSMVRKDMLYKRTKIKITPIYTWSIHYFKKLFCHSNSKWITFPGDDHRIHPKIKTIIIIIIISSQQSDFYSPINSSRIKPFATGKQTNFSVHCFPIYPRSSHTLQRKCSIKHSSKCCNQWCKPLTVRCLRYRLNI